jgi:predicted HAD superfamily phosphohydrolase YqeG
MPINILVPDLEIEELSKSLLEMLIFKQELSYLVIDMDRILTPFHTSNLDYERIQTLNEVDIPKYIVSNRIVTPKQYKNNSNLCKDLEDKLSAQIILGTRKPFSRLNVDGKGAMIGDSLFFDVLFAKYNGLYSILLKPLPPSPMYVRVFEKVEKLALALAKL